MKDVSEEFGVAKRKIRSSRRTERITLARDELCRRLKEAGFSYPDIGEFLGRDHSTIMTAVQRARERLQLMAAGF